MIYDFNVTPEENGKILNWLYNVVYPSLKREGVPMMRLADGYSTVEVPYTGAIGGNVVYSFTPTSLGVILTVKETLSGLELDLTDYDSF
jgi:hypothetical protein